MKEIGKYNKQVFSVKFLDIFVNVDNKGKLDFLNFKLKRIMENKILSSKYFAPLAIGMISVIVFLNNYEHIHPIVKYLFLLFSLVLSFYYNPFAIVKVVTDKSMSDIKEKVMYAISFVILSTISAYLFILMFTTSENVLLFGKILAISNGIFAMVLYFVEKTRSHLLLIHLLLVFIFTTLIQIL